MRIVCLLMIILLIPVQASATEITAPTVPESAQEYMPEDTQSFGEGLWYVIKAGISQIAPSITDAFSVCISLVAMVMLTSLLGNISANSSKTVELAGALAVGLLLVRPSGTLVELGAETVTQLSDYGKLILPTLTAALAAQGGVTASASLYAGTALFSAVLSTCIQKLLIPLVWIYLCLGIASGILAQEMLENLKQFLKWLITWSLKIILYVFTGYMTVTGVVSGSADAAAIKATKITISGFVPVVGGIISEASEAILVSAGLVKSSVGIYGMLAVGAMIVGPFLSVGVQYTLLKITSSVCKVMGSKHSYKIIQDFARAMGMILGMVGTVGLLLIISTFCFMRGVR